MTKMIAGLDLTRTSVPMRHVLCCLGFLLVGNAAAAGVADLTNTDATNGLRQALNEGSIAAVGEARR